MKKVAVLGANGFLGRYITNNLKPKGYDVIEITRSKLNLSDYEAVKAWLEYSKPDVIINCAMPGKSNKINNLTISDLQEHLKIFDNFKKLSYLFGKYINIGSGAEFDREQNIDEFREDDIYNFAPKDTYGDLKNLISRLCRAEDRFYTLRLFGCFDKSEDPSRLFAKLFTQNEIEIIDRQFDYFSASDFLKVLEFFILNDPNRYDVNCVYMEKHYLSEQVKMVIKEYGLTTKVNILKVDPKNYTGSGYRLDDLDIELDGLMEGIRNYR